ncbi:MAG: hypothetical protein WDN69_01450 [Aliidongia sp.]
MPSNPTRKSCPANASRCWRWEKPIEPDPDLASLDVALPHPETNQNWPQAGGVPSHDMGHPALPDQLAVKWTAEIGEGASRYAQLLDARSWSTASSMSWIQSR